MAQHDGFISHIVEQRHVVLPAATAGSVVEDAHLLQALLAELRLDVKGANAVDVVAPEVDAVGQLVAIREHVEDRAAHAVLAGLIHIVGCLEAQFAQACRGLAQVGRATRLQVDGASLHILAAAHTLGECLRVGDHPAHLLVVKPAVQHLGAQDLVGSIHLAILDVALVARGEDERLLVACQLAQVIVHVARLIKVVHDDQVRAILSRQPGKQHSRAGPRQPVNHGITTRSQQLF